MIKQVKNKLIMIITSLALIIALATPSFAWFAKIVNFDTPGVEGRTDIAYFDGGDGSPANPYIITDASHLYNLAWLQYLGYFNLGANVNNGRVQSYFRLDKDINMENYVIPPIGTSEYPFFGGFDGNGKIISNATTSNDFEDLKKNYPKDIAKFLNDEGDIGKLISAYDTNNKDVANVNGLFGVVGDYKNTYSTQINVTKNTTDQPSGTENVFYELGNAVKNFGLNSSSVNNISTTTTVGIVAGYVNATVKDILIYNCKVQIPNQGSVSPALTETKNLSDFTTIGYATPKYVSTTNVTNVDIYADKSKMTNNNDYFLADPDNNYGSGNSTGWGGSIDMESLHSRLKNIYNNSNSTASTYLASANKQYTYLADFVAVNEENPETVNYFGSTTSASRYKTSTKNQDTHGSYVFSKTSNSNNSTVDNYIYLSGGTKVDQKKIYGYTQNKVGANAYVIKDTTNGTRYLSTSSNISNTNIKQTSNLTSVTNLLSEGVLSPKACWYMGTDKSFAVDYNGILLYLDLDSNYNLILNYKNPAEETGNANTTWEFNDYDGLSRLSTQKNGVTRYVYYDSSTSTWKTKPAQENITLRRIYYDNNYLLLNNTNISSTTSVNSATEFVFEQTNQGYLIYTTINNQTYYLTHNSSDSLTVTANTPTSYWTIDNLTNTSARIYYQDYYYYYINIDNNTWQLTYSWRASNITSLNLTNRQQINYNNIGACERTAVSSLGYNQNQLPKELVLKDTLNGALVYTQDNSPYIPLNVGDNYETVDNNTGYIISGGYDETTSGTFPYKSGDIRVSSYTRSSNLPYPSTIYTRTTSTEGYETINQTTATSKGLTKFNTSIDKYNSLVSKSNVFGLHFMQGVISKYNLVTAPKAVINGKLYENYQMPGDCINFRLKQSGYINFYSGTYFNGNTKSNNMFFSLHEVIRDSTFKIIDIKEIMYIYKIKSEYLTSSALINNPYIYEYYGPNNTTTFSRTDFNSSQYDIAFDCTWLTSPKIDLTSSDYYRRTFYFEIPVNEGEFALGAGSRNVKANNNNAPSGAYLLYLDIAANTQDYERTTVNELFLERVSVYNHFNGVLTLDSAINSSTLQDIQNQDFNSAKIVQINQGYTGQFTLNPSLVTSNLGSMIGSGNTLEERTSRELNIKSTKRVTFSDKNTTTNNVISTVAEKIETQKIVQGVTTESNVTTAIKVGTPKQYGLSSNQLEQEVTANLEDNGDGTSTMSVSALVDSNNKIKEAQKPYKIINWTNINDNLNKTASYSYVTQGENGNDGITNDAEYIQYAVAFTEGGVNYPKEDKYNIIITTTNNAITVTFISKFANDFAITYVNNEVLDGELPKELEIAVIDNP